MSSTSITMSLGKPVVQNHACPLELGFSESPIFFLKEEDRENYLSVLRNPQEAKEPDP